jgi:hypothetical protein
MSDKVPAQRPTPKMMRECANILETAPHDRQMTAEWLRQEADKDEALEKANRAIRVGILRRMLRVP